MKRIIVSVTVVCICIGLVGTTALADEYAFGDLGKPPDYDQTIKLFRDVIPDFDAFVDQALPTTYDWRDYGMVTVPKDQQNCGGCWAFASVGALESKMLMIGRPAYDASEQQQISCNTSMSGCAGGSMSALQYWYDQGAMLESCTGYPSSGGTVPACSTLAACSKLPYRTMNYYTVDTSDPAEIKSSCYYDGPTYFRWSVWTDFTTYWNTASAGDVYTNTGGSYTGQGHAVLIIGWDDSKNAWLLRNSWGASTGPNGDGTFWMAKSGHTNDQYFGMANVEINYANAEVLHKDGAIWRSATGWQLSSPPNYSGSSYAVDMETSDSSYTVLHTDGAYWNSGTGWVMSTPPYYPGTGYAMDLETGAAGTINQTVSNYNTYANQDFETAYDTYDIYIADDFTIAEPWDISTIYVPSNTWSPGTSLMNANSLNWEIYANSGGVPAGYPGGGSSPVWSLSVAPSNSQVTLSTGSGGYLTNVTLNLTTPASLSAGTYWLVFYPQLDAGTYGQAGRHPSATTNGYDAMVINPGGGFGFPATWTSVQSGTTWGLSEQDFAFRLETASEVTILDQDGALWNSNTGWTTTSPPYYAGSDYARDVELSGSSYAILHKDGAIYRSATGWILTSPPYYSGSGYARDLEIRNDVGDYTILHKDGCAYDSVDGWFMNTPPYYSGSDYTRDLEVE